MSYTIEYYDTSVMVKSASFARRETEDIMSRIYNENPEYWPYGLDIAGHDGGVYLIRDNLTKQACGFVGWQERFQDRKKIGYYSIGVLPEYRGKGFAKEAVSKIIKIKTAAADSVRPIDEVRAFIVEGNDPSHKLAESLGVPVVHDA